MLKRYHELGGEIITVGADAHKPEHVAYDFDKVSNILKDAGFMYYTVFETAFLLSSNYSPALKAYVAILSNY